MRISDWSSDVCSSDLLVELPANLRGVWINVIERKALKPSSCLELGIRGDGRKVHRVHIEVGKALLRRFDSRSEEHTSELQSLMRISYAVFCLKKKKHKKTK